MISQDHSHRRGRGGKSNRVHNKGLLHANQFVAFGVLRSRIFLLCVLKGYSALREGIRVLKVKHLRLKLLRLALFYVDLIRHTRMTGAR
jgi:hypothetical protein